MLKINKKAFSLIELSIVILIIGILVAGVTQSSRLISRMRILSARSITQSSPVPSVKDVYSWHETVLESSFDEAEASDGTNVTNWYDLNPQVSSSKIDVRQNTLAQKPIYTQNSINGLPSLYFDGNDFLTSLIPAPAIAGGGSATAFAVFNSKDVTAQRYLIFQLQSNCANNVEIGEVAGAVQSGSYGIHTGCGYSTNSPAGIIVNNQPYVMTLVMLPSPLTSGSATNIQVYKNGVSQATNVNGGGYNTALGGSYAKSNSTLYLGSRNTDAFFFGNIGEIIIYSRSLNAEERNAIEKYLGKKWGIAVQ
jgi:prepilin-type N-terminal cleavage/methylation domain-containing protein